MSQRCTPSRKGEAGPDVSSTSNGRLGRQSAAGREAQSSAVLEFGADTVLTGIVYHLVDEGDAGRVSDDSIRRTRQRLERKNTHLSMARELWESLSNRERLNWLLSMSQTSALFDGGVAILKAAD